MSKPIPPMTIDEILNDDYFDVKVAKAQLEALITEARTRGYSNGFQQGQFDRDMDNTHGITNQTNERRIQALITEKVVKLANLYGEPRCENLHHAKKNQHTSIEDCPVEKAINEQLKEKL